VNKYKIKFRNLQWLLSHLDTVNVNRWEVWLTANTINTF